MEDEENSNNTELKSDYAKEKTVFLSQFSHLNEKGPNDSLLFIVSNRSEFLSLLQEDTDISLAIFMLGKACNADSRYRKTLNKLMINLSSSMNHIVINIQRYILSLNKLKFLVKEHVDALLHLTQFLKAFQLTLPSSSIDTISILLPLLESTCNKALVKHTEIHDVVKENLKLIKEEQKQFFEHNSLHDQKKQSKIEKLHLEEPPENFRSISILPTIDDLNLPCSFLRPNLVKGKYKDAEHYLDVQFRLLREDYIKPLRDGLAEYTSLKKENKSFKNCKHVRVYCNAFIDSEEFVDGDLLHKVKFEDKIFSTIKWEYSKRFLTGNLLCFSVNDFRTMLFATVVYRDPKDLMEGLLLVKFVETDESMLKLGPSVNYVVIEIPTLFESYRHNLKVLQQLDENLLPMKSYIINVSKTVNKPEYLESTTVFDMRPLLVPFASFRLQNSILTENDLNCFTKDYKTVHVTDENEWPTAAELKLDESQYVALKCAVMKEFAIIQGPPGTGKTYIGLRIVELLLHNLSVWFHDEPDCLPMLIVCYTNHALDQFLEGISQLTRRIVRIGGRGSNEKIAEFQIKNLVKRNRYDMPIDITDRLDDARMNIEEIKEKLSSFEEENHQLQSTNDIVHEAVLRKNIPRAQFNSLTKYNYAGMSKRDNKKGKIYDWLEINAFTVLLNVNQNNDKTSILNNGIKDRFQAEAEADIEFTENQRNIDCIDFKDRIVLRKSSKHNENDGTSNEHEWHHKINIKKNLAEYIKNSLENNPTMKEQRALKIKNVWRLPINEKWQLYKFWLQCFLEDKKKEYLDLQNQLKTAVEELSNIRIKQDLWVIEGAIVVGMTTTGAAKYRHILEAKNPVVLIVEEAAEILESHIITSLAPKTKHVILIGDQQQLRPSPTVHALAVKYGMNISLFERMIMNGMDYCRLSLQHRMRPEIAALIVPHIYSDLKNHEVVTKFENIKGVCQNVFFVTHEFEELHVQDSKSKVNDHEARFIIRLCKYLIYQGYEPSQITALTTYSGQLFALKRLAVDDDVRKVRFTVVDNFQGEENDIVLISFVRSNNEGDIGFLKISNRVCVALSRAKKGLFCIGNFAILAENSKLWMNILQTLTVNKCIGPSLRLTCQNHPDVFNDVANDSDFNAVPEGGCNRKCEYRLPCGHSCTLLCHPYDSDHEAFECKKPCIKICENGHPCPKNCFEYCYPCPVTVPKLLSKCGHTVNALCGENESDITCFEACKKSCKIGHPCPKKCFDYCYPCPVIVPKLLSKCGHTVNALCGENESEITCLEACKKSCKEGHPCPKKCFEYCGSCYIMVNKILSKCKHTVEAPCSKPEYRIKCENKCNKACPMNHPCPKKCFESCDSCEVKIEKTLNSCGHTIMVPCGMQENKIKCSLPCKKLLPCSHQCKNMCYQLCEKECLQLIDILSPVCGHSVKIECCFAHDSVKLANRCLEPCGKILLCGHLCSNKCKEPCSETCKKIIEISSPVCGHLLNIECCLKDKINELSRRCLYPCKKTLTCGHTCRGNCGSCYQGRLHVSCNESCNRTLICGHKCEAKCSISCPPCKKPCKNRCVHKKCPKKCGDPCIKCVKPCNWFCDHKKCTRRCSEICDRNPCNEKCLKILPCNHQCVGFCGEPCPKECFRCRANSQNKTSSTIINEEKSGYVYLEDCKHTLKENDLREWLSSNSSELHELKPKTCPQCGTIIRTNVRFNAVIKSYISDVDKIKEITRYNKDKNLNLQRNLLKHINESHPNINDLYKSVIKVLSGGRVRDIYELTNLENIMNIAKEIELKNYDSCSMFSLTPFMEDLVVYTRYCREWMIDFIGKNFLCVSECQLQELSKEVYRLSLLSFLLNIAKQKHFASLSPEFEQCALSLRNFSPLSEKNVGHFKRHVKNFVKKMKDLPGRSFHPQEIVNMSALWYQCSKGHVFCLPNNTGIKDCYKCRKETDSKKSLNLPSKTYVENYSTNSDDLEAEELLDEDNFSFSDDTIRKDGRIFRNDKKYSVVDPTRLTMGTVGKKCASATYNSRFPGIFTSNAELRRKQLESNVSKCGYSRDDAFRKKSEKNNFEISHRASTSKSSVSKDTFRKNVERSNEKIFSYPRRTFKIPTVTDISRKNTEEKGDRRFSFPTKPSAKPTSRSYFPRQNIEKSNVPSATAKKATSKELFQKYCEKRMSLRNLENPP